ncbi:MAG: hypothetical protein D6796_06620 [Caldilineae bacterium]|nr:MAG: hypothetical protein D6796_06620 [Caldilineae bacterium]
MQRNTIWVKLWAFGLTLAMLTGTYLVIAVNPVEVGVIYLGLLAIIAGIGLVTNVLGGSIASVIGVFAVVFINQRSGIYPRENLFINVATELILFLMVGPLAGRVASLVDRIYRRAVHWRTRARQQATHDEAWGMLKPEWAKMRLEEEILRAQTFQRPLSVVTLEAIPHHTAAGETERAAVMRAMARVARSLTAPPAVITRSGSTQLTLILPEFPASKAAELSHRLMTLAGQSTCFPENNNGATAKTVSHWGDIRAGIAMLNGQPETADSLLERAQNALHGEEAHV